MSVIRPYGPAVIDPQLNIVKPGDPVKWVKVDEPISTTIKPSAIIYQPKTKTPLPPMRKGAINIPGEDSNRDFAVKTTQADISKLIHAKAEFKRWATMQPPPQAKIYDPDNEEPWPFAIKLSPPTPRPNLKFNPETFTHIPNHVKNRRPYQINPETKTNWAPPTNPPTHIAVKPNSKIIPRPPDLYTNQPPNHVVIRP